MSAVQQTDICCIQSHAEPFRPVQRWTKIGLVAHFQMTSDKEPLVLDSEIMHTGFRLTLSDLACEANLACVAMGLQFILAVKQSRWLCVLILISLCASCILQFLDARSCEGPK